MNQRQASAPKSAYRNRKIGIAIVVILILISASVAGLYFRGHSSTHIPSTNIPFDYQLSVYPINGTVEQGNSILTNVNISYVQGSPENVTLNAFGGPTGTTYSFSNQTGTPSTNSLFTSNLTINVPASATTDVYSVNVSATAVNGRTYSSSYTLSVLSAEIQVSGTIDLNWSDAVTPSAIEFVNTSTNSTYEAAVHFIIPTPWTGLVQQGTYSISLPNQQSYNVNCLWDGFFGTGIIPLPDAYGTDYLGILSVNGGVGVTLMMQNYLDSG